MSKYSRVILLCEDLQQEVFARTFLVQCGIPGRRIYTVPLPNEGAGESFVRREYPKEVKALRQRATRMNICLTVMIDADNRTVTDHFAELDRALQESHLLIRQEQEKIGIFVPKRNIETWIRYLGGNDVDEMTEYPHLRRHEGDCKPLVKQLAENRHQALPEDAPLSLHAACDEIRRILPE